MYFCLWNLESWALESGIQPKWNNSDPTKDWDPGARSIQPKFQPVGPGKVVHLKRWTRFFETFRVGPNRSLEFWTEFPGNFGWMDRALLRLPWIPLPWGDNLVPRLHSVLRWKVGAIESLAVFMRGLIIRPWPFLYYIQSHYPSGRTWTNLRLVMWRAQDALCMRLDELRPGRRTTDGLVMPDEPQKVCPSSSRRIMCP